MRRAGLTSEASRGMKRHAGATMDVDGLADHLLAGIDREYPNQVTHVAHGDAILPSPRERHPIFYGCYDWHSAVHSHWALFRLRRHAALSAKIDAALAMRIEPDAVAREIAWLSPRPRFELPYGLAWLLALAAEARRAPGEIGQRWRHGLAPLEALARDRLVRWIERLPAPIRSGEHAQSAFAMTLVHDWARVAGDDAAVATVAARARAFHAADRAAWHVEPSAYDFLSPGLAVAWLMSRVADPFGKWLDGYAPDLGRDLVLEPPVASDRGDGKLVHWDGLALSRAWMLIEIARALPVRDRRIAALTAQADAHGDAGSRSLVDATYAGLHWLPSFAVYWLTARAGVDGAGV
jgi:hypothetical protein